WLPGAQRVFWRHAGAGHPLADPRRVPAPRRGASGHCDARGAGRCARRANAAGQLVPPPGGDCRPARARSGNPRAERSRRRDRGAVASLVAHFRRAMAPGTYNPFRAGRSLADARRPGWLAVERARLTLTRQSRLSLAAVVALLLIVFAVRAHNALAMPIFNDESLH